MVLYLEGTLPQSSHILASWCDGINVEMWPDYSFSSTQKTPVTSELI